MKRNLGKLIPPGIASPLSLTGGTASRVIWESMDSLGARLEILDTFLAEASASIRRPQSRARAIAILTRWATAWQGPSRTLEQTRSIHGSCLHFNQLIGSVWCHAFAFHAVPRDGLFLRGPDTDRTRKSHKLRSNRLDSTGLDALFTAWSARPEAHPAGNAVEFWLEEVPDEVWEASLQEALECLKS
jgi:hypothetical protein